MATRQQVSIPTSTVSDTSLQSAGELLNRVTSQMGLGSRVVADHLSLGVGTDNLVNF